MARQDGGSLHMPDINFSINMDGKESVLDFIETLNKITRGNELHKYWKDQTALINDMTNALARFNAEGSEDAAKELVNIANALKAMSNTGDISNILNSISGMNDALSTAGKMVGQVVGEMSPSSFREAFSSFELLNEAGMETTEIFKRMSASSSVKELIEQIESLNNTLSFTQLQLANAKRRVKELEDGSNVKELEDQIDEMAEMIDRFSRKAKGEFSSFLSTYDNDPDDYRFQKYFDEIEAGYMTAKEAIAKVKLEYGELFDIGTQNGLFSVDQVSSFVDKLEEVLTNVQDISTYIHSFDGDGGLRNVAEDLSKNTGLLESQRDAMAAMAQSESGINSVTEILTKLIEVTDSAEKGTNETVGSLSNLVGGLKEITAVDTSRLQFLAESLAQLRRIGGFELNKAPVDNLARILGALSNLQNAPNLSFISTLDLSAFKDLKVSKAALNNLATYLPQIAAVKMSNLKQLGEIDFTNLSKMKVNKSSVENLLSLTNVAKTLNELSSKVDKISGGKSKSSGVETGMSEDDIERSLARIYKLRADISAITENAISSDVYSDDTRALMSYEEKLRELETAVRNGEISTKDFSKAFSTLSTEVSTARVGINGLIREAKNNNVQVLVSGTREYADAQSKLSSGVGQSTSAIQKYVGAMSSNDAETQNAYVGLLQSIDAYKALSERLESGTITQAQFDEELKKINADAKLNITALNQSADSTFTLDSRIKAIGNSLARVLSVMYLIRTGSRFIRDIANEVVELDSAFTQLRIVTGANSDEMERFKETSVNLAKDVGRSVTDIAGSIETFSRLGYSLSDASELARNASILSNVAGVSTESATTGLTAIIKGFNFGVEEASHVSDVLVEIGQKYAVSASEMMEAYEKSGAALNATNLTFEKSAGLIAAANAAIQNSSTVGTALKTVAARIRGSKTDLIEMGEDAEDLANGFSKYAEEVKQLSGVSILEPGTTDEFRDLYDIFSDLSEVWEKLSDTQQARVSEIFGGARQLQVISSIIGNWKDAENAYVDAQNAMGAATEANNIYMESAAAKQQQMQASYQAMANSIMSSGLVGFFYDAASALFGFVGKLADLKLLIPGVVSALVALKAVQIGIASAEATRRVSGIATQILSEKVSTDALRISVNALTNEERQRLAVMLEQQLAQKGMTADEIATTMATYGLSAANQGLAASFKAVQASIPVWGWISLGISLLITLITAFASDTDDAATSLANVNEEIKRLNDNAEQTMQNFRALRDSTNDIADELDELANGVDKFGNNVSLSNEKYERFTELNNKLAEMFPEIDLGMDNNGNHMLALSYSADTLRDSLLDLVEAQREAANAKLAEDFPEQVGNVTNKVNKLNDQLGHTNDIIETMGSGSVYFSEDVNAGEIKRLLDKWGIAYNALANSNGVTIGLSWDVDDSKTQFLLDRLDDESGKIKDKISSSWSDLQKYIVSKVQTDSQFNDLDNALQDVATRIASGLDISRLGLIGDDGAENAKNIEDYVEKSIVAPLKMAQEELDKVAESFNSGEASRISMLEESDEFFRVISSLVSLIPGLDLDIFAGAFLDAFGLTGDAADVFIEHMKVLYPELRELADVMDDSSRSATRSASDFVEAFGNMGKGMQSLAKIYSDVKDGGTFDFAQLLSDDFRSAFSGLGDEYNEFIDTIASSSGDIGACQEAFDKLVDTYIRSSGALEGVTEETYDAVVAMLKSIGVTNAEEVATNALAEAKSEAAMQSLNLADKTADEILALYAEGNAADVATQSLYNLVVEKVLANRSTIKTDGDIQNLIDLAKAAGATNESLNKLTQAKGYLVEASNLYSRAATIGNPSAASAMIAAANAKVSYAQSLLGQGLTSYKPSGNAYNSGAQFGGSVSTGSTGSGGSSGGSSGSSSSSSDKDNWFTREYKRQKHLIELEQESYEEFFDWLDGAYKKAYKEGIIDLDDFRKYEEEVFDGRRKIFDDYINDIDHEISMRENFEGDSAKVLALNLDAIYAIEKQIQLARKSGLTDNDDYIQDLQKQWMSYYKDIQKLLENSYDKRLSALKDFYDKQKKLLQDAADEEKYLEEQAEKRKSVADIRAELARLEYDNSAWAQKRRLELMQSLAEAEKDLNDFEKDNALNNLLDTLDKQYEEQEKRIKAEMEALSGLLNDPNSFFNKLLSDISETSKKQLYYLLLQYTDGGTGGTWSDSPVYGGTSNTTLSGTAQSGNLFTSSDGNTYSLLTSGAGAILNAIRAINNFKDIYGNQSSTKPSTRGISLLNNNSSPYEIRQGDIIINGNTDTQTVSEIRRAQRDSLNEILRGLAKLKK